MNINLEDPRLSAYALGEMDEAESKEFEALLENDPAARAEVEAIRQMAGMLASELQAEPAADMSEAARAKVVAASAGNIVQMPKSGGRRFAARLVKIAAVLLVVGGAVAILRPQLVRDTMFSGRSAGRFRMSRLTQSSERPEEGIVRDSLDGAVSTSVPPAPQPTGAPVAEAPQDSASATGLRGEHKTGVKEQMEALKVEEPKPMFVGTPKDLGAPATAASVPAAVPAPPALQQSIKADYDEQKMPRVLEYSSHLPPGLPTEPMSTEQAEKLKGLGYISGPAPEAKKEGGLQNVQVGGQIRIRGNYFSAPPAPAGVVNQFGAVLPPGVPAPQAEPPLQSGYGYYGGGMGGMGRMGGAPGTESYKPIVENEFKMVRNDPLSTFSIDVDTASYANVRRFLNDGQLPPPDAVRIEELVNYFKYDYPEPEGNSPFSVTVEANACPWNRDHALALVGLRGRSVPMDERAPINLVFLLDVSGSMQPENKLPMLKKAMRLLVDSLGEQDRVGIVTYASNTGVALPSTSGGDKSRILSVLDVLQAGGSTNGAGGIQLAYEMAARNFIRGGVNRIVLATDGDFNVGMSDTDQLVRFIEDKAKSGVFLSVLGFGEGNLQDDKLEGLADKGNGNYAYIDSFAEARRVLLDDVAGTMVPIAKDVKIQIEFNPAQVGAYRLIGYENRIMAAQDFNDDRKDAGEIGSGHTVTALYELVPPDGVDGLGGVDPLKYQQDVNEEKVGHHPQLPGGVPDSPELMTVKLRYKQPDGAASSKFEVPLVADAVGQASPNLEFASSVAMFGMLLRGSRFSGAATFDMALALAEQARGADKTGQRTEFASLVQTARALAGPIHVMAQAEPATAPGLPPGFHPPESAPGVPPQFKETDANQNVRAGLVQPTLGVPPAQAGVTQIEELSLELPQAMFVGTPKNIVSDNLDPDTGKPRPPLMVPAGTRKLSEGAPVSASDEEPIIGEIEMITDGDKEGSDGSFVEFGPGVQWVQIDLGQTHEINAIAFWHYHSQARIYHDVIVRVSDDKDFITYTELFNNDHDNTAKLGIGRNYDYIETNQGKLIDAGGVQARYVRLYSNGNTSNDMNHMIEVEVFGR
ncbi:MAG: von Willebrand factor type A domain-containing protein [Candidatus Hydrogenedentes bacterium]|nr:von Willebrand factor type A domain-containing protein [Candidatus Hydrogenedentota bacterium]